MKQAPTHKWLVVAGLAYLGVTLLWSAHEAPRRGDAFAPGSVWSSRPEGWSLAFEYLAETARRRGAPPVTVLDRPTSVVELPANGVLFRVQPFDASEVERQADDAWVARGGRLVLVLDRPFAGFEVVTGRVGARVQRTFPWGGDWRYRPIPPRGLAGDAALAHAHTLYAADTVPLAVRRLVGAGEVFVFASPEAFSNAGLGRADHLAILTELVGAELAGGRPVFFDETGHGTTRGARLLTVLGRWGLTPALCAVGLLALLYLWRAGSRLGPAERDPGESRSEAVDLVDSLADLYGRALTGKDALALYAEGLARTVVVESGASEDAARARARELAPAAHDLDGPKDLGRHEFATALDQLNNAYDRVEHARHR